MENTLQRIKKYIDFKGVSVSAFERKLKFSNGSFASQLKNGKTIGVDKLEHILKEYNDLDANWLFTGKGQMIKKNKTEPLNSEKTTFKEGLNSIDVELLQRDLENAKATLEDKIEMINTQRDLINSLKSEIELIKKTHL